MPRALLLLGDLACNAGTTSEFTNYYDPASGSLKPISRAPPRQADARLLARTPLVVRLLPRQRHHRPALWDASVKAGAKPVLTAHDHNYERLAPQSPTDAASTSGPREFLSGPGGRSPSGMGTIGANSQKPITVNTNLGNLGVPWLTCSPTRTAAFRQVNGTVGDADTTTFQWMRRSLRSVVLIGQRPGASREDAT